MDIILLPGDIMDDNVNAYLAEKMQPHLAKLKAPMGRLCHTTAITIYLETKIELIRKFAKQVSPC